MEFPFDINPLFPERISVLDHHLQPGRRGGPARATLENQLAVVLDKMGEASAKAQLLSAPITSASRMQVNRHRLYLLKDGHANHGKGAAIGFLKVGNKKLFVLEALDKSEQFNAAILNVGHTTLKTGKVRTTRWSPCVCWTSTYTSHCSDMDTAKSCLTTWFRHLGLLLTSADASEEFARPQELLRLIATCTKYEGIKPDHLAIDRPSSKFLSFLRKHYGLAATIPQVNNFVVFDSFFRDRQMRGARLVHRSAPKKAEQDIKPYSITVREGAPEDQELPWPFNQASSLTRSNSLGCSSRRNQPGQQEGPRHIRGLRPQLLNGAREADDTSDQRRRTCDAPVREEMVTTGEASAASGTPSQPPDLGREKSSGPCPGQKSSGRSDYLGHGGTSSPRVQDGHLTPPDPKDIARDLSPLPSGESQPAQLPQPPPSPDQGAGSRPAERGPGAKEGPVRREREVAVRSPWTETQLPSHAQWIRHKNKFRNTRPW